MNIPNNNNELAEHFKDRETITTLQSNDWGEEHTDIVQDYIKLQDKYAFRTWVFSITWGITVAAVISYLVFLG